jgi:hypothetical protein
MEFLKFEVPIFLKSMPSHSTHIHHHKRPAPVVPNTTKNTMFLEKVGPWWLSHNSGGGKPLNERLLQIYHANNLSGRGGPSSPAF